MKFLSDSALINPNRYRTRAAECKFLNRYHREAPEDAWREAVSMIKSSAQNRKKFPVRTGVTENTGCETWHVRIDGELLTAVYNPEQSLIVTILEYGTLPKRAHHKRYVLYDYQVEKAHSLKTEIARVFGKRKP